MLWLSQQRLMICILYVAIHWSLPYLCLLVLATPQKEFSRLLAGHMGSDCVYPYTDIISIYEIMSTSKSGPPGGAVNWKTVGRRIRELRGFDLTQEDFAARIGVSQNYLSTMERGQVQIGSEILLRIGQES